MSNIDRYTYSIFSFGITYQELGCETQQNTDNRQEPKITCNFYMNEITSYPFGSGSATFTPQTEYTQLSSAFEVKK